MKTTTHFALGLLVSRFGGLSEARRRMLVLGAVAPDFCVIAVFGTVILMAALCGRWPDSSLLQTFSSIYFGNAWFASAHNILHSPLSLVLLTLGSLLLSEKYGNLARAFLTGCATHSLTDILTHRDDGPLLLWPLDWSFRYASALSHWDSAHFGTQFMIFEIGVTAALAVAIGVRYLSARLSNGYFCNPY